MTTASPAAARARRRPAFDPFAPIWRMLTSVRFAVTYIAVLAVFGLLGVIIPQIPEPMRGNAAAIQVFIDSKRGMFGPLTDPMYRLGLFGVFQARWFQIALGFLVLNVTVCTFNRWSPTFRNVFNPPRRVPETFFERAHNRVEFAPAAPDRVEAELRRLRFRVERTDDPAGTYLFADRYAWAQLGTFISHMALILFIAGGVVTAVMGFQSNAFAGEGTTVPVFAVRDANQMQIRIDDAVGKYGDRGNAIDFRTYVTIFKNGTEVKSGVITVNDPLEYGGYRFHQVAYWADGVELRIRDLSTGNTVLNETFPLQDTTAAPRVTITGPSGDVLLNDVIAPTDFLPVASGTLVAVPGAERAIWLGITSPDAKRWQLVAFDPQARQQPPLRIDEGGDARFQDFSIRFDRMVLVPSSVGFGVPGSEEPMLAQLVNRPDGSRALMLVASGQPAISLAENDPTVVGGYEYTFEGQREFTGIAVKRDSGAWFIWIATAMLLIGLAVTFYVPRRRLWLKITGASTSIAALAEKSGGFEKDMRLLATRIGVPVPPQLEEER